jgi:membrane associated rhomboid family serine protease
MRSRYPSASTFASSFGPGPLTPAIKALIIANIVAFAVSWFARPVLLTLGLQPADVIGRLQIWQPFTYMFLHGGIGHILFNMLALWMFGTELERMWGSRYFLKFYFVAGVGAGLTTIILSFTPVPALAQLYNSLTIGASGAIYGVLLAYGLYFPNRPIYLWFVFPIPAKYFVMIMGAIAFFMSMGGPGGGVAHITHLGGLLAGYIYLKGGRVHIIAEIKYRYLKWRINRMRKRFDVYSGGRADDVDRRVH